MYIEIPKIFFFSLSLILIFESLDLKRKSFVFFRLLTQPAIYFSYSFSILSAFALNSDIFLTYLQKLTGIKEKLFSDPYLLGGGYHEIKKGGFLDVHADFNKYKDVNLDRRINLLLYLNRDWNIEWNGNLGLYNKNNLKSPEKIITTKIDLKNEGPDKTEVEKIISIFGFNPSQKIVADQLI